MLCQFSTGTVTVVGRVLRKISAACSLFLQRAGIIHCTVVGVRYFSADIPQGGLEVPCTYKFLGKTKNVVKILKFWQILNLAGIKFGGIHANRQTAKLNSLPNFPAIDIHPLI